MARVAWTFLDDSLTPVPVQIAVNPHTDNGSMRVSKEIGYVNTAGPDGKTLIYENGTSLRQLDFTGFIYTEDEYDFLVAEVNLSDGPSVMQDDRQYQYNVYWDRFTLRRVRSARFPWKHEYSLHGYVTSFSDES